MATLTDQALYKGIVPVNGAFVILLKTEWNETLISTLEEGALRMLNQYQIAHKTFIVPGAFELPFAAAQAIEILKPDAIICLGAVIRGDTPHFEYVCQGVTQGLSFLNAQGKIPVIFGVLTVNTPEQAWERAGGVHGHKGEEAALAAIKMLTLSRTFHEKTY